MTSYPDLAAHLGRRLDRLAGEQAGLSIALEFLPTLVKNVAAESADPDHIAREVEIWVDEHLHAVIEERLAVGVAVGLADSSMRLPARLAARGHTPAPEAFTEYSIGRALEILDEGVQ